MKVLCNCIRIPTIVGWEDTLQVGSFPPIGLGPISDGCTPSIRIGVANSRISVRVIMT